MDKFLDIHPVVHPRKIMKMYSEQPELFDNPEGRTVLRYIRDNEDYIYKHFKGPAEIPDDD